MAASVLAAGFFEKIDASIERVFRYFLTGVVVIAAMYASHPVVFQTIQRAWPLDSLWELSILAVVTGMVVYAVYRLFGYAVIERIADWRQWSGPSSWIEHSEYHDRYARFLYCRHISQCHKTISTYLFYRWSLVHFVFILGVAIASCCAASAGSLIDSVPFGRLLSGAGGLMVILLSLAQQRFLFKLERGLFGRKPLLPAVQEPGSGRAMNDATGIIAEIVEPKQLELHTKQ